MKKLTRALSVILICAVLVTAFTGCMANPEKQILGKWKDSVGIVGYEFLEDGTVKFTVMGIPVTGTYTMDKKEETVTLTGSAPLVGDISHTYKFVIEESKLTLTDAGSNTTTTYTRVATTTAK